MNRLGKFIATVITGAIITGSLISGGYAIYERKVAQNAVVEVDRLRTELKKSEGEKLAVSKTNLGLEKKVGELSRENSKLESDFTDSEKKKEELQKYRNSNPVYEKELKTERDNREIDRLSSREVIRNYEKRIAELTIPDDPNNPINVQKLKIRELEASAERDRLRQKLDYEQLEARYLKSEAENRIYVDYIKGKNRTYGTTRDGTHVWVIDNPFYKLIIEPQDRMKREREEKRNAESGR